MSHLNMGYLLSIEGKSEEAIPLQREVLERARRVLGMSHRVTLASYNNLAMSLMEIGSPEEAEPLFRDSLEAATQIQGAEHPETLIIAVNHANVLTRLGRAEEAVEILGSVLQSQERVIGLENPVTRETKVLLADLHRSMGRHDEALRLFEELVSWSTRVEGPEARGTLRQTNNVAVTHHHAGRLDLAEELFGDLVTRYSRTFGSDHSETQVVLRNLGNVISDQVSAARDASDPERLGSAHHRLGSNFLRQRDFAAAENALREAWELALSAPPREEWKLSALTSDLGAALVAQGRLDEGEGLLLEGAELLRDQLGEDPIEEQREATARAYDRVVDFMEKRHRLDPEGGHDAEADRWRRWLERVGSVEEN